MNKVIKHGLQIMATLDPSSQKELRSTLNSIFADAGNNIDFNSTENRASIQSLAKAFQSIFTAAGNTSIDFDKLISLPSDQQFAELGKLAATQFWDAWNSVSKSRGHSEIISSPNITEQLQALEKRKLELNKQSENLDKRLRRYEHLAEVSTMDIDEFKPLAAESDLDAQAERLMGEFVQAEEALNGLTHGTKEYYQTLVTAVNAAENLYRMHHTINQNKGMLKDKSYLSDYDLTSLSDVTSDVFEKSDADLNGYLQSFYKYYLKQTDQISQELNKINTEINTIKQNSPVDEAKASSALKTLEEIDAAYARILNKNNTINKTKSKNILSAIEYEPGTATLTKLENEYTKSFSSNENWEIQYQWLVKFVKEYEAYAAKANAEQDSKKRSGMKETLRGYTKLYEQLKPMAANAENMLQNILNTANNVPLVNNNVETQVNPENVETINAETQAQEKLNAAETQNPPAQSDAEVHNANTNALNAEVQAQEKLNAVENQNPQMEAEIKKEAITYDELRQKVEAYFKIRQKLFSLMDQKQDWMSVMPDFNAAQKDITSLFPETGDGHTTTASMISKMFSDADQNEEHMLKTLANTLGIKIPQAAQQAEAAINGVKGAQEGLNGAENQNPPAQNEAPVHNANAEAIEKEAAAEGKLAKARKAVRDFFGGSKKFTMSQSSPSVQEEPTSAPKTTGGVTGSNIDASAELTGLKASIESLTAAIKTGSSKSDIDKTKKSFDIESLKGILTSITYNVKVVSDIDGISSGNVENINKESAQPESGQAKEPWALENTLNGVIKSILEKIQANTAQNSDGNSQQTNPMASAEVANIIGAIIKNTAGSAPATESTLSSIKSVLDTINSKIVKGTRTRTSNNTSTKTKNAESYAGSQYFPEKIKTQQLYLAKFRTELQTTGRLTDSLDQQINELLASLNLVKNGPDLSRWNQQFLQLKASVGIVDAIDKVENKDVKQFETETSAKTEQLMAAYKEFGVLTAQRDMQPKGLQNSLNVQIKSIEETIALLEQELGVSRELYNPEILSAYNAKLEELKAIQRDNAYKEDIKRSKQDFKSQVQASRSQAKLTQANSTSNTADKIISDTMSIDGVTPENLARLKEYQAAAQQLSDTHNRLKSNGDIITPAEAEGVKAQTNNVRRMNEEYRELLKQHERLSGDNATVVGQNQLGANASLEQQRQQLIQIAMASTNGKARIGEFNAATGELAATVNLGNYEVAEYAFSMDALTGSLVQVHNGTKRLLTPIQMVGKKIKEFSYYFTGSMMIYRVIAWVREGITAVQELDSALTELKKVTDETEESYNRFLDTASKTAGKIGSTISDFTKATATFAKLGYDMKMASEMAEAAVVYQNVGDGIENADAAAESIISTIKGFNLEASESMRIVDRFNEVGNRFSITSKGIGDALQRSASALSAGGNTLDESIGLITAANEVVQDPESVGTALKTLSLRLRGAKTELEEAGLETENMAETTATLQKKLLGLTGGKVDIMLDED